MMGVCGLFFFMVGYARERKDLDLKANERVWCQQTVFLPRNLTMFDGEASQRLIDLRQLTRDQGIKG